MSPLLPKLNDKNEICCQALKMLVRRIHCVTEGGFPENTWYFSSPYCHAAEVQPGTSGKMSMTHKVNNWKMWFRLRSISPPGRSSPQLTAIPGPHTSTQVQEKVKVSRRFPSQSPEPDKSGSSTAQFSPLSNSPGIWHGTQAVFPPLSVFWIPKFINSLGMIQILCLLDFLNFLVNFPFTKLAPIHSWSTTHSLNFWPPEGKSKLFSLSWYTNCAQICEAHLVVGCL